MFADFLEVIGDFFQRVEVQPGVPGSVLQGGDHAFGCKV